MRFQHLRAVEVEGCWRIKVDGTYIGQYGSRLETNQAILQMLAETRRDHMRSQSQTLSHAN
jgi:hypothetical protein